MEQQLKAKGHTNKNKRKRKQNKNQNQKKPPPQKKKGLNEVQLYTLAWSALEGGGSTRPGLGAQGGGVDPDAAPDPGPLLALMMLLLLLLLRKELIQSRSAGPSLYPLLASLSV